MRRSASSASARGLTSPPRTAAASDTAVQSPGIDTSRTMPGAVDRYRGGMRGDRVEIVVDAGGETRTYNIAATKAGRRVEINTARGQVQVAEVTRGGTAVRTGYFMAARVIALVEHPAEQQGAD